MGDMIMKGPHRGLRIPRKQVFPRADQLRMRCGKCSGMEFEVHILPDVKTGTGQAKELVCLECLDFYHLDDRAIIQADGKIDARSPLSDHVAPIPSTITAEARKRNGS